MDFNLKKGINHMKFHYSSLPTTMRKTSCLRIDKIMFEILDHVFFSKLRIRRIKIKTSKIIEFTFLKISKQVVFLLKLRH